MTIKSIQPSWITVLSGISECDLGMVWNKYRNKYTGQLLDDRIFLVYNRVDSGQPQAGSTEERQRRS